jgi:hypothetical protein
MSEVDEHLKFAEQATVKYLAKVKAVVETALNSQLVASKEKTELRISLIRLQHSVDWIVKYVVTPIRTTKPESAANIYDNVRTILSSALIVGSTALLSDASQKVIQWKQARTARAANPATAKRSQLISAIKAVLAKTEHGGKVRVSEKFAGQLRPQVLDRLEIVEETENSNWPSVGTIKNALREIREGKS